jgi:hypothetical protein
MPNSVSNNVSNNVSTTVYSDKKGTSGGWFSLENVLLGVAILLFLNYIGISYFIQIIPSLLKALYLSAAMVIYGFFFLVYTDSFNRKEIEPGRWAATELIACFAAGFVFTSLFFFAASLLRILNFWTIIIYYIAPLPLLLFIMRDSLRKEKMLSTMRKFFRRPSYEYLVFIFPLVYAVLPPSFYDTLAYHLGIPNLYLQNGGFIETPQLFYANAFIYNEIAMIPAIFAGEVVPRLFHYLMGVILILAAIDFGVEYFKISKRYLLLLAIVSMPMSVFLLTMVKNDLPSALFILAAILLYKKNRPYLSGVFWGFSIGIKYTNAVPMLFFFLLYYISLVRDKRRGKPRSLSPTGLLKQVVVIGLISAALLLPAAAKNYNYTGNPVFPFFQNLFENKIQFWDDSRVELLKNDARKLFYSLKDVVKFPLSISFEELGSGGVVGPLFLMFLPFLLVKREKRLLLLLMALLTIFTGAFLKLSTRVWYIAFIFLSIYVVAAYESISHALPRRILTVLFFVIVGFNLMTSYGLQEFLYRSFTLNAGQVDTEQYKGSVFPAYKAFAYANRNLPPDVRVLVVGEGRSYYLKRPYRVASGYDYCILRKYLGKSSDMNGFLRALQTDGIGYIIFNRLEFQRLQEQYHRMPEAELKRTIQYLNALEPVFQVEKDGLSILKIPDMSG